MSIYTSPNRSANKVLPIVLWRYIPQCSEWSAALFNTIHCGDSELFASIVECLKDSGFKGSVIHQINICRSVSNDQQMYDEGVPCEHPKQCTREGLSQEWPDDDALVNRGRRSGALHNSRSIAPWLCDTGEMAGDDQGIRLLVCHHFCALHHHLPRACLRFCHCQEDN